MTIIQAQLIGDRAILPRTQLEELLELARRSEPVDLQVTDDELTTAEMMRLAESGRAFDFWREAGEDIYSITDGEPL